jgi:hypothetical protein
VLPMNPRKPVTANMIGTNNEPDDEASVMKRYTPKRQTIRELISPIISFVFLLILNTSKIILQIYGNISSTILPVSYNKKLTTFFHRAKK